MLEILLLSFANLSRHTRSKPTIIIVFLIFPQIVKSFIYRFTNSIASSIWWIGIIYLSIYISCAFVLCMCVFTMCHAWCLLRSEEAIWSPGIGGIDGCEPLCRCLEPNLDSLQEPWGLLISEQLSSCIPNKHCFVALWVFSLTGAGCWCPGDPHFECWAHNGSMVAQHCLTQHPVFTLRVFLFWISVTG